MRFNSRCGTSQYASMSVGPVSSNADMTDAQSSLTAVAQAEINASLTRQVARRQSATYPSKAASTPIPIPAPPPTPTGPTSHPSSSQQQ
ncbi:hypothetical protein ABBQ32_000670 [Trebouxia sp. C0010 RCD-2024]